MTIMMPGRVAAWLAILVVIVLMVLLASGCTTIGVHTHKPTGEVTQLRLCGLLDDGLTRDDVLALLHNAWGDNGVGQYGVQINLHDTWTWPRPGFTVQGIMQALDREPRPLECDLMMAFVGRHVGDWLWSTLVGVEVLGAAHVGGDRGFVVATHGWSLNQLLRPPRAILEHELLHILGCGHGLVMGQCYKGRR